MLGTYRYAPSLHHSRRLIGPTGRCWPRSTSSPTLAALGAIGGALREGLAASRQYEHLRSRGISHDTAIREALGLGHSREERRKTAAPLYFAGRA
jgi:hypothetical protein